MTKTKYQGIAVNRHILSLENSGIENKGKAAFEIIYIEKGEIEISVCGHSYRVKQGNVAVIRPEESYVVERASNKSEIISFKLSMTEIWQTETNSFLLMNVGIFANKTVDMTRIYSEKEIEGLCNIIAECIDEWENKYSGYEFIIRTNIERILIQIFRISCEKSRDCNGEMGNEYIERAITHMESNLKDSNATEMAEYVGLSYTYFLKLFKEVMGCNFVKFAHNKRIQESKRLLFGTNKNLDKIAQEVGFSTTSHFIKVFKGYTGMTPAAYRRQVMYGKSKM